MRCVSKPQILLLTCTATGDCQSDTGALSSSRAGRALRKRQQQDGEVRRASIMAELKWSRLRSGTRASSSMSW